MMEELGHADVLMTINDVEGGSCGVQPDQEREVSQALQKWCESGGTRDTLLELVTRTGATYYIRASCILSVYRTTTEQRAENWRNIKADQDERRAHREAAGIIAGIDDEE